MKRFLLFAITISLLLCEAPFLGGTAFAADAIGDEWTSGNYTYKVLSLSPAEVSIKLASGATPTSISTGVTITHSGTTYKITQIPASGFSGCSTAKTLSIGSNITTIGGQAFKGCGFNATITIPANVTSIGYDAFWNCTALKTVNFNASSPLTTIGTYLFEGCSSLTSVTLPPLLTTLPGNTFKGCTSLTAVTIPASVTSVANTAFNGCTALTTIHAKPDVAPTVSSAWSGITPGNITLQLYSSAANTSYSGNAKWNGFNISTTKSGSCGTSATWLLDFATNTLTISGSGAINDYTGTTLPWGADSAYIYTASVSNDITRLGNRTFYECKRLTHVSISNSKLTSIGQYAFYDCKSLVGFGTSSTQINIPKTVTTIENHAFNKCSAATKVYFMSDAALTSIGDYAFQGMSNVTDFAIYNATSLSTIGGYAFKECPSFSSITLPANVTSIGSNAFASCTALGAADGYANFKGTLEQWAQISFVNSESNPAYVAKKLKIDGNLITECSLNVPVSGYAFRNNLAITSLTLGSGCTSVGSYAFAGCTNLTGTLTIPSALTTIGNNAFSGCTGYTAIDLMGATGLTTIQSGAFDGMTSVAGPLYLPATITSVGTMALRNLTGVTEIFAGPTTAPTGTNSSTFTNVTKTIPFYVSTPDALTSYSETIAWSEFTNMKVGGFCGASPNEFSVIWVFNTSTGLLTISGTGAMKDYANSDSNRAPWYAIRTLITSIKICNGVTRVGNYAFNGCNSATEVWTSTTVTSFGSDAFNNCSGLTKVKYGNTSSTTLSYATDWAQIDFANSKANPLYYAHVLQIYKPTSTMPAFGTVTTLENRSITQIKKYAFYNCTSITTLNNLSSNLSEIGYQAFYGCTSLTSVTIPQNVTKVGDGLFKDCSSLTTVVWDAANCTRCLSASSEYDLSSLWNPFFSISAPPRTTITSFSFGPNVEHIPSGLCYNMTNTSFTSVTIPSNVTSMGTNVYQGCSNLRTVNWNATNCADFTSSTAPFEAVKTALTTFKFGYGVHHIPAYLCKGMTNITGITGGIQGMLIPTTVTSIGEDAFDGCSQFTRVDYEGNNSYTVTHIDDWAQIDFASAKANPLYYAGTLYVVVPPISGSNSVPGLGEQRDLVFKETTTTIKPYAFVNLTRATSVTLGTDMTTIGAKTFDGCSNITSVTSWAETPPTLGSDAWNGVPAVTPISVLCPDIETAYKATDWNRFTGTWSYLISTCNDNLVIESDKTMSAAVASSFRGNILVKSGVTFTMNNVTYSRHVYIKNLTLEPAARIELTNDARYKIINLIMQRSGHSSTDNVATAQIKGSLTANNLILDFTLDDSRWFPISLPQTVSVSNVTIGGSSLNIDVNSPSANCYAMYFDGARRATEGFSSTGDNWQWLENSGSFEANKGYLIGLPGGEHTLRFTMPGYTFNETTNKNVSVAENPSDNYLDAGWNLIGNPFLQNYHNTTATMAVGSDNLTAVVLLSAEGEHLNYSETEVSEAIIPPFSAMFVQSPATGSLVFDNASARKNSPVRRQQTAETSFLQLSLIGNGASARTNFLIGDDYNENYTIGADLVKWFNDNYKAQAAPTLYSYKSGNRLAFNARSEQLMTDVPVGFYATKDGAYTFSLTNNADLFECVLLRDLELNRTIDLKTTDYEFQTAVGTVDNRFTISAILAKQPEITTDINKTEDKQQSTRKIIKDGHLYILHGENVYTATGQKVL